MKKLLLSRLRDCRLSTQVNIVIGFIIMAAVVLLTAFAWLHTGNQTRQSFMNSGLLLLQETMDKINSRLRLVENTMEMIAMDSRILDYGDQGTDENEVFRYLRSCYDLNRYDLHQGGLSYVKNLIDDILFVTGNSCIVVRKLHFSSYNMADQLENPWFQAAWREPGKSIWTDCFLNASSRYLINSNSPEAVPMLNHFMLIRYIIDEKDLDEVGWIAISVNLENLSQVIDNIQFGLSGSLFIVDQEGTILAAGDRSAILTRLAIGDRDADILFGNNYQGNFLEGGINQARHFIFHAPLSINGWKLLVTLPLREIEESFYQTVTSVVLLAFTAFIILTLMGTIILHSISNPLHKMLVAIQETRKGNITSKVDVTGCMEVKALCVEYNTMLDTISSLLNKVMEEQQALRKSELKMLRAQINPHFLYNTLDSIKWLIHSGDTGRASELISSLSTFFRLGLSGGSEEIRICDEVEHVRHYLFIQNMRCGERMRYLIDVDSQVENNLTPKLILQPIIENAIIHGLNKKDRTGVIRLLVLRQDDTIRFDISDNGVGMTAEELNKISGQINQPVTGHLPGVHGFALRNVNQRIRLAYGHPFGVQLRSQQGVGTRVVITIPVIERAD